MSIRDIGWGKIKHLIYSGLQVMYFGCKGTKKKGYMQVLEEEFFL